MSHEPQLLRLALLNAENLFLLFDQPLPESIDQINEVDWQKLSTSVHPNKPIKKLKALAQFLTAEKIDIVMLCEVGGLESLINFNQLFLNSQYSPALIEGNSNRGIDVGFLISKKLQTYFDIVSNKNRLINYLYPHERSEQLPLIPGKTTSHKFSRDVVELRLFNKARENPWLVLLLTHLKSPLDPERKDPNGFERREAELKTLVDIYLEIEKELENKVPIIVAGDFNGNAGFKNTDTEFKALYEKTQLKDVLELSNIDDSERFTFFHVRNLGQREGRQIDYCFLSPILQSNLIEKGSYVYRYKDELGFAIKAPQTMDEKLSLPSDHYPIVTTLQIKPKLD